MIDPQKLAQILDKFLKNSLASCPQGLPAQITQVHPTLFKADVRIPWNLLLPDLASLEVPLIPNVPFLHTINKSVAVSPVYQRDDFVWLSFSSFDLQIHPQQLDLPLSLSFQNAVIVGHFASFKQSFPNKSLHGSTTFTDLLKIHSWIVQAHPSLGVFINAPCRFGSSPQAVLLKQPCQTAFRTFVQQVAALPPITPADGGAAFKSALTLSIQNLCDSLELAFSKEVFLT